MYNGVYNSIHKCGSYQHEMFYGADYDFYENHGWWWMVMVAMIMLYTHKLMQTHTHTLSR